MQYQVLSGARRPISARSTTSKHRHRIISCSSASGAQRTAALRRLLAKPGLLLGPAAYDGISARLTEEAGFDFAFMSGFSVAGGRLAKPDTGLLSYAEMLDQGRCMHEATHSIPIIGDGDTGYGNALNVKRTVQGYGSAGFAGILIEDQQWPKSCGHVRGKRVIPRAEAIARVRAACDARDEMAEKIVIVARTDARQAESFQEALERAIAFADAGADIVFVDALASVAEMRTLCVEVQGTHKMANMLEGGGKTPILSPQELEDLGFKICAYPLSLLGVSINAMRSCLAGLKQGKVPVAPEMPSFQDLQAVLGFPEYFEEESKYAVEESTNNTGTNTTTTTQGGSTVTAPASSSNGNTATNTATSTATNPAVDPDRVIEPGATASVRTVDLVTSIDDEDGGSYRARDPSDRRAQWLRIKISDARTGAVQLDTRFPAGFLGPVAAIVPQVAGLDLEALVRGDLQQKKVPKAGEPAFSFEADGDRIEVFLEDS